MNEKLYVLVRRDLPLSQQVVQACHAVAEWSLFGPDSDWDNGTLIVLGVSSERQLKSWMDRLTSESIPFNVFSEPDIGDHLTALAVAHTGEIFSRLSLL